MRIRERHPSVPACRRLGAYIYHLCELEKYLVSFPIFSAAKPKSKEILNSSACTVADVSQ